MSILQALFAPQMFQSFLFHKVLGSIFLLVGGLGGGFFLFQILAPWVGYFESGAIICGVMSLIGGGLLFMKQESSLTAPDEIGQKILTSLKELDVEKVLKDNAMPVSLFSLGLGFVLSQLKGAKNLSALYKMMR